MRVRLTPAIVAKAKPGPSRLYLWDTEVPGLGLVVHPGGTRTWVYQGIASDGRRVTLDAPGLSAARKMARNIRVDMLQPERPAERVPRPVAFTFGSLLDAWLTGMAARPTPPVSLPRIHACMDNHVRPRLGHIAVGDLRRADVVGLRDALVARGVRGTANQTVAYVRAALRWAEDAEIIEEAPRWRVRRLRMGRRAHALSDEQWTRMIAALSDADAGLHPLGRLALLALCLTGCRRGEIAGLRWCEVSNTALTLVRHKTSSQTGPKTIEVHAELLAVFTQARHAAQQLADAQPTRRLRDALLASPYVFPSIARNGMGKPIDRAVGDTWAAVRRLAALPDTMTVHGLRGAFITQAQRMGVPLATVAAMVGHESPLTTLRHYSVPTRTEVAEGAERVAGWISRRQFPQAS